MRSVTFLGAPCAAVRIGGSRLAGAGGRRPFIRASARRDGRKLIVTAVLADGGDGAALDVDSVLRANLPSNPDLRVGTLANGFRYVILPNPTPPNRFEAHLEVHGGSVDEGEDEQGIAHLVEHVTFLGSKKRESLLGTGARSNAYTDFHHTVFHVHAPLTNVNTGEPMLPQVLDALNEIAFEPEFSPHRIEKERKAVLAEAQMMNTIEYRIDCQLLKYLHHENNLGCRFPIGMVDQVKQWPMEKIRAFWQRWYFPANTTLYVVGDLPGGTDETEKLIQRYFGAVPVRLTAPDGAELDVSPEVLALPEGGAPAGNGDEPALPPPGSAPRSRHDVRPPVEHVYGMSDWQGRPVQVIEGTAPVRVFRHPLLQHFQLSLFCKMPVREINSMEDLRYAFIVRLVLSVLQFRINGRYVQDDAPFISIEMDSSDAGREGCCVSTLTITSEPKDWRGATSVAIEEVRRLQKHGVSRAELERYLSALLRDSAHLADQAQSVPSVDNLDYVMESMALGHKVLDHAQSHAALEAVAGTIAVEQVNAVAASLLSYISHYGREDALLEDFAANPDAWPVEPTRATSIVACIPAYMDASGHSTGGGPPVQRGASMTTMEHVDVDTLDDVEPVQPDEAEVWDDPPEGAVRFELEAGEIAAALSADLGEIDALEDVDVPQHLIDPAEVDRKVAELKPEWVPPAGAGEARPAADPATGVVQRRLSNGVRVNYRRTENEPGAAVLRLAAPGGRSLEDGALAGAGFGSVGVGVRAASESGTVGEWRREQVELFCISKLINCMLETDEEFVVMDFHLAVQDGGLQSVFELMHQFLEAPRWEESALERSKKMFVSHYQSMAKSLERATADRIMDAMIGPDRRFRDPTPEDVDALQLGKVAAIVTDMLRSNNLEVNIVGDFDEEELEGLLLRFLGTLQPTDQVPAWVETPPLAFLAPTPETGAQRWHLKDSDERACAYIAGPAPARWDVPAELRGRGALDAAPLPLPELKLPHELINATAEEAAAAAAARRRHPLYRSSTLMLLSEVINARLFTTVRDSLGLTYDVSFEMSLFDRLPHAWYVVSVTSEPKKIDAAMNACVRVLRGVRNQAITPRELARARRTIIARHETDLKDNGYCLGLLTHLQSDAVPLKTIDCLKDLVPIYEACTIEDVYDAYNAFDFSEGAVFTCIGTSGKDAPPPPPAGAAAGVGRAGQGAMTPEDKQAALRAMEEFMKTGGFMQALQKMRGEQQE
ncbi:unnamed protein product [Pedinophyceae sp. YPF-701]|nr:unnamed protein product [Pedinophyceae sp. YPF-701]